MPDLKSCFRRAALVPVALIPIVMIPIVCVSAFATAKGAPDRGLRFDSTGVLDLASRSLKLDAGKPLTFGTLPAADAVAITATASITDETPLQLAFSEDQFGCKQGAQACMKEHEAKLIAQADGAVKRLDKRLVVAAGAGAPAIFADWTQAETKTADGDQETHWYLGRMTGNGYHRVEVQFGHDAPGNFLINPKSGKMVFVHSGADIVAHTTDGKYLFTLNTLNPPLSLRVAQLDDAGPKLVLLCAARADDEKTSAEFKGWHNNSAFDMVVHVGGAEAKHDVALRISHGDSGWSGATAEQLAAAGFACKAL
jgi:hypothetical protein